jgi:hypothetical protein
MFVTSDTYVPGSLAGATGGDAYCNQLAQAAHLPGTFVAWLSTSTTDASKRLGAARGWIRPDGRPFADSVASLTAGIIFFPPRLDEHGADLIHDTWLLAATGTGPSGALLAPNANDWTSTSMGCTSGGVTGTTDLWTRGYNNLGSVPSHLYCFGTDHQQPLTVQRSTGRTAFLSKALYLPSGGVETADALCQQEATTHGLQGTYRALIATQTSSAASRFDLAGLPWIRTDGIPWVLRASDLTDGKVLTALNVTAAGDQVSNTRVWTGSADPRTPAADPSQNCADWHTPSQTGWLGEAVESASQFFFADLAVDFENCTVAHPLYCLQD